MFKTDANVRKKDLGSKEQGFNEQWFAEQRAGVLEQK
jgi:hypothetical protein